MYLLLTLDGLHTLHPSVVICILLSTHELEHLLLQLPYAEALAVYSDGRIAAIGSRADILLLKQPATKVQNLQNAFVMPVSHFIPNAEDMSILAGFQSHAVMHAHFIMHFPNYASSRGKNPTTQFPPTCRV